MYNKKTEELEELLKHTQPKDIGRYIAENADEMRSRERSFMNYINELLKEKKLQKQDVLYKADISRGYGYKLLSEEKITRQRDVIHLINSGATTLDATGAMSDAEGNPIMKCPWEMTADDVDACLKATTWYPADRDYFRGGGFSSNFLTRGGMPMTMMRVNRVKGLGPVIQLAEGWSVDLDPEIHDVLNKRTDKTWPTTWFVPRLDARSDAFKDVYSVMNNWGANHGAIAYGHIGADVITLASILRIPVCMHNVADDQIFRPSAWNAFGMDKEGADYRACQNFGPVYK